MSILSDLWAVLTSSRNKTLTQKVDQLMTTSAELVTELDAVTARVDSIGVKVLALATALEAAGNLPAEVDAALAALKAEVANVEAAIPVGI
jgi:hypothetical protein